jgi:single-strand DNA-binding protein
MSSNIKVIGNVTKDPELKFSNSGMAFIRFSVADTYKDKQGNETTTFYDVVAFDTLATNISDTFVKGTRVFVEGRFAMKEFERKDGSKGTAGEITADSAGPELRFAKAQVVRNERNGGQSGSRAPAPAFANASTNQYATGDDFSFDPF